MNTIAINAGCSLSDVDWKVVDIGLLDGPRSMNSDSLLARLLRNFFGLPVPPALANERLEALRRFSIRAWYFDLISADDVRRLKEAGYSAIDLTRIVSHVARYRGFTPKLQESVI